MSQQPVVHIAPPRGMELGLRDVWWYRDLLLFLVWRDIKIRYRQTVIGAGWAVLQPLLLMILFTFFLGLRAGLPSDGLPFPVFYLSALVPWFYFSGALDRSAESLVNHQQVIKKVYFPRLILPVYAVFPPLVDFVMAFVILLGLVAYEGLDFSARLWVLPLLLVLTLFAALAGGLWLSAINALYRDIREAIPVITRFLFFASPVIYPVSIVPEGWRWLYGLNPVAVVINRFRWAIAGPSADSLVVLPVGPVLLLTTVLFVGGLFFFRRLQDVVVDVI